MITVKDFIKKYETFAPPKLKMGKDPIGLHFGHPDNEIHKMMTTLDIRPEVVQEAIDNNVDFILAHHPPIFRPVARFDESDPQQKMYADIIRHNISIYASHTNLDVAKDGMNDWLAEALGLSNIRLLSQTYTSNQFKLTVFVPHSEVEQVLKAAHEAGAGQVGDNYEDVSYAAECEGRFTPVNQANPTIGSVGEAEKVEEKRIEMLVEEADIIAVIEAVKAAHPYEEPVYDIYKLAFSGEAEGIGRIGELDSEMSLESFIKHVSKVFNVSGLRYVEPHGQKNKRVKTVAICGGDGSSFNDAVIKAGVDVYVTGDVYYHDAHDMQAAGITLVDPGHHIEAICIPKLAEKAEQWADEEAWDIDIIQSQVDTEPFQFYKQ